MKPGPRSKTMVPRPLNAVPSSIGKADVKLSPPSNEIQAIVRLSMSPPGHWTQLALTQISSGSVGEMKTWARPALSAVVKSRKVSSRVSRQALAPGLTRQ
jgi:hypothetical protein